MQVGDLENVVSCAHHCYSVLEVVEWVIHLAVVLVNLHDETTELEWADFVSLDYLSVGKHRPNVSVELMPI